MRSRDVRMTNFLYRLWFVISQIMAVLSLATIVDQARSWDALLRWAITQAPPWIFDLLQIVSETLSFIAGPWREFGAFILSLIGVDWPTWVFSAVTIVILAASGVLRQSIIRRNQGLLVNAQIEAAMRDTMLTGDLNDTTAPDYVLASKNIALGRFMWSLNLAILYTAFWLSLSALLSDLIIYLLE